MSMKYLMTMILNQFFSMLILFTFVLSKRKKCSGENHGFGKQITVLLLSTILIQNYRLTLWLAAITCHCFSEWNNWNWNLYGISHTTQLDNYLHYNAGQLILYVLTWHFFVFITILPNRKLSSSQKEMQYKCDKLCIMSKNLNMKKESLKYVQLLTCNNIHGL